MSTAPKVAPVELFNVAAYPDMNRVNAALAQLALIQQTMDVFINVGVMPDTKKPFVVYSKKGTTIAGSALGISAVPFCEVNLYEWQRSQFSFQSMEEVEFFRLENRIHPETTTYVVEMDQRGYCVCTPNDDGDYKPVLSNFNGMHLQ